MNSTIQFEFPYWWVGLCLLLGLVYAIFLYYNDRSFKDLTKKQQRWIWPLGFMRFLAASAIAVLLLGPLIKTQFTDVQKPYIVVAQDNSTSVGQALSPEDSTTLSSGFLQLAEALGEDYELDTYAFGNELKEGLSFSYEEKVTNLSQVMDDLYNRYNHQNVGAIIMSTDGIFNEGSNPSYQPIRMNVPIYTVALGDTTAKKDIKIEKVLHNRIAYLDDKFTIRVDVSAFNCKGNRSRINVYKGKGRKNKVFNKSITIGEGAYFHSEDVILDADKSGVLQYTITVAGIDGEHTTENNYKTIYIDVLDARQKILLLANSPHPDVSAIKASIEQNKNYEVTTKMIGGFNADPASFDLVILHGLPSLTYPISSLLDQLEAKGVPRWFIMSSQTSISNLNNEQQILKVNGANNSFNEVKANTNSGFGLFKLEPELITELDALPPMRSRFGEYEAAPAAQVFMKQQIGSVETNYPLMLLGEVNGQKSAVLTAEGLWRWRLFDYMKDSNNETLDNFISKTVQYLAVKEDKRKFRVNQSKKIFSENENISFDAELYNNSYELVNEPDATMRIVDADGKVYPYTFSKAGNAYELDAGILPVGAYTYRAKTVYTGEEYKASGGFTIKEVQLETVNTIADHSLLYQLSTKYGGEMLSVNQISELAEKIKSREDIKPVLYSSYKTQSVINKKWLFFLILALLAIEWFVRKYLGSY